MSTPLTLPTPRNLLYDPLYYDLLLQKQVIHVLGVSYQKGDHGVPYHKGEDLQNHVSNTYIAFENSNLPEDQIQDHLKKIIMWAPRYLLTDQYLTIKAENSTWNPRMEGGRGYYRSKRDGTDRYNIFIPYADSMNTAIFSRILQNSTLDQYISRLKYYSSFPVHFVKEWLTTLYAYPVPESYPTIPPAYLQFLMDKLHGEVLNKVVTTSSVIKAEDLQSAMSYYRYLQDFQTRLIQNLEGKVSTEYYWYVDKWEDLDTWWKKYPNMHPVVPQEIPLLTYQRIVKKTFSGNAFHAGSKEFGFNAMDKALLLETMVQAWNIMDKRMDMLLARIAQLDDPSQVLSRTDWHYDETENYWLVWSPSKTRKMQQDGTIGPNEVAYVNIAKNRAFKREDAPVVTTVVSDFIPPESYAKIEEYREALSREIETEFGFLNRSEYERFVKRNLANVPKGEKSNLTPLLILGAAGAAIASEVL